MASTPTTGTWRTSLLVLGLAALALLASATQVHAATSPTNNTAEPLRDLKGAELHAYVGKEGHWNTSNLSIDQSPNLSTVSVNWLHPDPADPLSDFDKGPLFPDYVEGVNFSVQEATTSDARTEFGADTDNSDIGANATFIWAGQLETGPTSMNDFARADEHQGNLEVETDTEEFRCDFTMADATGHSGTTSFFSGATLSEHAYHWWTFHNLPAPNSGRLICGVGLLESSGGDTKVYFNQSVNQDQIGPNNDIGLGLSGRVTGDTALIVQLNSFIGDPDKLFGFAKEPFLLETLEADFTFNCDGRTCDFTDQSTPGEDPLDSWDWAFGDGSSSTQQNPTHTYDSFGTFTVNLTVTDTGGTTDSVEKSVNVRLAPEFNVSAGLPSNANLQDIATTWNPGSPEVWGRDTRGLSNFDDGALVQWNETLTHQATHTLCPDDIGTFEESNTLKGLAVSKDSSPFIATSCLATGGGTTQRVVGVYDSGGDMLAAEEVAPEGEASSTQVDLSTRSLNNLTTATLDSRQLLDLGRGEIRWRIFDGSKDLDRAAIEWDGDDPTRVCFTGLDGTECRDGEGFLLGETSTLTGQDLTLFDGTVHILDKPTTIERRTVGLTVLNTTNVGQGLDPPIEVSKAGRLVAHVNESTHPKSVDVRLATNLSHVVQTEGNLVGVRDLSFHPRTERLYVSNATRVAAYNLTSVLNATANATQEETQTDVDDEEDEDGDPGGAAQDTAFADPSAAGDALGLNTQGGALFLSIILILALTVGAAITTQNVPPTASAVVVSMAALGGAVLTWAFGWFPIWALFIIALIVGAILVRGLGLGGAAGGGGV